MPKRVKSGVVLPVPGSEHEVQRLEFNGRVEDGLVVPALTTVDANTDEVLMVHKVTGVDGAPGEPGEPGTQIEVGEGEPTAAARAGDLYIDSLTGTLYRYG